MSELRSPSLCQLLAKQRQDGGTPALEILRANTVIIGELTVELTELDKYFVKVTCDGSHGRR